MAALVIALSGNLAAGEPETVREEVSVRAKAPAGPALAVPEPRAGRAVTREVLESIDLERHERGRAAPAARLPAGLKRLERPFPEPPYLSLSPRALTARYDRWVFEVLCAGRVVRREEGDGPLRERLDWDGFGEGGTPAARVDAPCRFRFTGFDGPASFAVESEAVTLRSLALKEFLGDTRLEVSAALLFEAGKAKVSAAGKPYLEALARLMRRAPVRAEEPYRLALRQKDPAGRLARDRAALIRRQLSQALVVNPRRVELELLSAGDRGEALSCRLPPEKGAVIRTGIE